MPLPRTPKEVLRLSLKEWILYNCLIAFFKVTGLWEYPMRASCDLETMSFLDKVYWLYKTNYPIKKARRNSGLEAFFDRQKLHHWHLPEKFDIKGELSLSAVGDLINHEYLSNSQDELYSEVSDIVFGADISMANLECVVYQNASGEFLFSTRSGPSLYYDIENFNIVKWCGNRKYTFMSAACNHSLDFGAEGADSTIRVLKEENISFNGINEREEDAFSAAIIEKKGFRIGMVAYTFGLNARKPPKERPLIVNRAKLNGKLREIDFTQMEKQINYCQEAKVDFIIAHLHWGMEHEFYPTPEQVEVAHYLSEMGIDAIIGHHPHVVQPVEFYRTKRDSNRVVPIYYSLGNLINSFSAPYLCLSYVAQISLAKGTLPDGTERTYIKHAGQIEVIQIADEEKKTLHLIPKQKMGYIPR